MKFTRKMRGKRQSFSTCTCKAPATPSTKQINVDPRFGTTLSTCGASHAHRNEKISLLQEEIYIICGSSPLLHNIPLLVRALVPICNGVTDCLCYTHCSLASQQRTCLGKMILSLNSAAKRRTLFSRKHDLHLVILTCYLADAETSRLYKVDQSRPQGP